jgi:hydroxymethylbilane synthase
MHNSTIRIGTRQSTLALKQAEMVKQKLLLAFPALNVTLVPLVTTGDRNTDRSLADIGGKGLFTKELEEGLLSGSLDIAVHSLKDMETHLRPGLTIAAVLERADPRDALLAPRAKTLANLPKNARIGTSSVRRAAQLKILRPDLEIIPFRGNITTRITKLKNGEVDATLLALAGLNRIGMEKEATEILDIHHFTPAAGQGVIAIECKEDNKICLDIVLSLQHVETFQAITAERSLLATLDGSCRTPIGGYARFEGDKLRLDAMIAKADGSFYAKTTRIGSPDEAHIMGDDAAKELLAKGGSVCLG